MISNVVPNKCYFYNIHWTKSDISYKENTDDLPEYKTIKSGKEIGMEAVGDVASTWGT